MRNIYLSNVLCKDIYPQNKGGEFSNCLNQTLKFDGSWSVALNEMYYIPNSWHNIRKSNNKILMKISQRQYTTRETLYIFSNRAQANIPYLGNPKYYAMSDIENIECEIPIGQYIDVFDLITAIVYAMNVALYEYLARVNADVSIFHHNIQRGTNDAFIRRSGQYERDKPKWVIKKDTSNKPEALREDKWVLQIPDGWDPNLIDGLYVCASIVNGHVIFTRNYVNKYTLDFAFSNAISQLLGYTKIDTHKLTWYVIPSGSWDTITAEYFPNMDVETLNAMWIMCSIIESTNMGHYQHIPLLRVIPANVTYQSHSFHNFMVPQFRKIIHNHVDVIKIWTCEDLNGSILDIYGDVFVRLEFRQNAK